MGRKPTISRNGLLETAEGIVREAGAAALTIDALAKAAGISKGGVQYSFSSKDELVRALVERWTQQFDDMMKLGGGEDPTPSELVRQYIKVMRNSQAAMNAKMAGLMISYVQNTDNLHETRQWYRAMFKRLTGSAPDAKAARAVFLAAEGLFLLRIMGIDEDGEWTAFLDDLEALLTGMA